MNKSKAAQAHRVHSEEHHTHGVWKYATKSETKTQGLMPNIAPTEETNMTDGSSRD